MVFKSQKYVTIRILTVSICIIISHITPLPPDKNGTLRFQMEEGMHNAYQFYVR